MRSKSDFTDSWTIFMPGREGEAVRLPHTFNAVDGQDGGNDYFRGRCLYRKEFAAPEHTADEEVWIEFEAVAMEAEVTLNGIGLARHEGGYSAFRVNLTPAMREMNVLEVTADNSPGERVYPQKADFTFYGGIPRGVSLLVVPKEHFALSDCGSPGIDVVPAVDLENQSADVSVSVQCENVPDGAEVLFLIEGVGEKKANAAGGAAQAVFCIEGVRLWDGVKDPYLYTASASLASGDRVSTAFGCRTVAFDADRGFILNGKAVRLLGASRHQDRQGKGNALTREDHDEDMHIIREMGANTLRLAHYQQSGYFYDLCDRYGIVVWAEIPYITAHLPQGNENTRSQMRELIRQNANHPSIVCWGLSNEITAGCGVTDDIRENHAALNKLCHELDPTRPTTLAHAFMLDMNDDFVTAADIRSYNLYYGWYIGETKDNDSWFDDFRASHPGVVIGLSEYGADANPAYQAEHPRKGDWTEGYQALYHEELLRMWSEREYIWAMHCWNMFDFGADGRDEGGKPGQNQKGLVTFDRKLKKDAFYLYKAYLSDEPFVHLCGKRYADRAVSQTQVRVYSNRDTVTLLVDGKEIGTKKRDKVFTFAVDITGRHTVEAVSGALRDAMVIQRVEKENPSYRREGEETVNWFDKPQELMREGCYSVMDTMEDLKKSPQAAAILAAVMQRAAAAYGDVAKSVTMPEAIQRRMDRTPFVELLRQAGKSITPAMVMEINGALNAIRRAQEEAVAGQG